MIWTDEKRKALKQLVISGYNLEEIKKAISFDQEIGKHSFSNAIKRYTTACDRRIGNSSKKERLICGRYRHATSFFLPGKAPLRHIPDTVLARMTEEERETALYSEDCLPAFHPLAWPGSWQSMPDAGEDDGPDNAIIHYLEEESL